MRIKNCLLALAAVLAGTAIATAHAASMFISPDFRVTQSGAASLSIPLQAAPGVNGMTPRIGLVYSSQGANGLVGLGWQIAGQSAITRCPPTRAQNGYKNVAAGTYTSTYSDDHFCLDGQQLVVVAGSYGGDGSEYRKEVDDQTRVISYGSYEGKGPVYFRAWDKAGTITDYGNTADSRIHDSDPQQSGSMRIPVIWQQNRQADRAGNYIDWNYQVSYPGNFKPSQIQYGGNTTAGTAHSNKIVFVYAARNDVVRHYRNGYKIQMDTRLSQVQMQQNGTAFLNYNLSYSNGTESRLTSVQSCSPGGNCLPALQFGTGSGPAFGSDVVSGGLDAGYAAGRQWVDVNGDGITDYCRVVGDPGNYHASCTLSTSSGLTGATWTSGVIEPGADGSRSWVDVNGDGRPDFCRVVYPGGNANPVSRCLLSTGSGFGSEFSSAGFDPLTTNIQYFWPDLNGDGKADMCFMVADAIADGSSYNIRCMLSTGSGFNALFLSSPLDIGTGERQFVDVNGDGFADFCRVRIRTSGSNPYEFACYLFNGTSDFGNVRIFAGPASGFSSDLSRSWVDVNGDGLLDLCQVVSTGSSQAVLRCNVGIGGYAVPESIQSATLDPGATNGRQWIDVNGDGMADFCRVIGSQLACTLSTGTGFGTTIMTGSVDVGYDNAYRTWRDVSGSGGAGYCRWVASGNQMSCLPLTFSDREITTISTQGLGAAAYTITYTPLTQGVHTRSSGATYPQVDAQVPLRVVSQVRTADGAGGVLTSTYAYGGLRLELGTGRGTLGMAWQRVTDSDTGVVTETTLRQDFPFTGMASKVTRKLNGQLLAQTDSQFAFRSFSGTTQDGTPTVAANKRYLVMSSTREDRAWELDGAFVSGNRVTQSNIDNYANVGTVQTQSIDAAGNALGWSKQSASTFANDATNWLIGRVQRTTVTAQSPNAIATTSVGSASQAGTTSGTPFQVPFRARPSELAAIQAALQLLLQD